MKVLVTGAHGFIGGYTIDELAARGHHPIRFDRQESGDLKAGSFFLGDIRDTDAVTEAMAHAEGFIHLAGVLGTQETITNPLPATTTNLLGGLNVLQAAAQYDVPGVNIAVGNHWMQNTYSITKSAIERFVEMYRVERHQALATVRAFNAYGPGQSIAAPFGPSKVRKIMPAFICRALTGTMMTFEEPIEAGTGRATTVDMIARLVADTVAESTGEEPVDIEHLPMRPGEPTQSVVLAQNPYRPLDLIDLEDGVAETVDWFEAEWLPTWHHE
jgi:UDP-glucose 4-epimerase